jgi:hypothetical protein
MTACGQEIWIRMWIQKRPWHVFRYNADYARGNVEGMFSQFGIPTTDIPNMVARRLSVGRVTGKVNCLCSHHEGV